ncbi:hypothetical protein GEMRC1_012211 [Eukaryota sp. GEM-RC1]
MRPLVQKAHTRPVSSVRYNADGDLFFTAGKDGKVVAWRAESGDFLGYYHGHEGAVNTVDCTRDSRFLLTGSADTSIRIWKTQTGDQLWKYAFPAPLKAVEFSGTNDMFLVVQENAMKQPALIYIFSCEFDENQPINCSLQKTIGPFPDRVVCAAWGPEDRFIYAGDDKGKLIVVDVSTGQPTNSVPAHTKTINDIHFSVDRTHFVTASSDTSIKLWDATSDQPTAVRVFSSTVPLNTAALSPIRNHVAGAGGMEAAHVTTSYNADEADKFTAKFWETVHGDPLGEIKGHFGPVHVIRFSPTGRSFVTGSEDGHSRLHHFDEEYFVDMERERAELIIDEEEEEL